MDLIKRPEFEGYFPMVDGAGQTGTTILTRGWPPNFDIAHPTDWISFRGSEALNPATARPTGSDTVFSVLHFSRSDGDGRAMLEIAPAIMAEGPYANVSRVPADGALLGYITELAPKEFTKAAIRMNK